MMLPHLLALATQLLLTTQGARVFKKVGLASGTNEHPASGTNEHPASPSCLMASGFDLGRGCQYPEAFQPVLSCDVAGFDQACLHISQAERVTGYTQDVRSATEYSELTSSIISAEAGGFAVSLSAGMSHMRVSKVTESSLAFFIGASGRVQTRTLLRPQAMKLTTSAKVTLLEDPARFIQIYGLKYIHSMTYGGAFLGSIKLTSRQTVDETEVKAFGNFSVNRGLFSASGSIEFENNLRQAGSKVSTLMKGSWSGGSNITLDPSPNPGSLAAAFTQWGGSWRSEPAPLTLSTRRWIDSDEVLEAVNSMSPENQSLFTTSDITAAIQGEISKEFAKVTRAEHSVAEALAWEEVKHSQVARSCFKDLEFDVASQLIRLGLLSDAKVLLIQQQFLDGDRSWFKGDSFHDWYTHCVTFVGATPTPAPVPRNSCAGKTLPGNTSWMPAPHHNLGLYVSLIVDTSSCGFTATPVYHASILGAYHWDIIGASSVYNPSASSFQIFVTKVAYMVYDKKITPETANRSGWHVSWTAQIPDQF